MTTEGPRSTVKGVYELLWDCEHCGEKELLGRTHRYCPNCAAPQNPAKRYFPPEGKESVASAVYDGADRTCPARQTAASARAHHCPHCGSPLDGAKPVTRLDAPAPAPPIPAPPAAPGVPYEPARRKRSWFPIIVGALLLSCCLVAGLVNHLDLGAGGDGVAPAQASDAVEVTGHAWVREIDVERRGTETRSAWCDEAPAGATEQSRRDEARSSKRVPDGETCADRKVDRGDGTFEKREDCTPRFRDEPVLAPRCTFAVPAWVKARTETRRGVDLQPAWPAAKLVDETEREGTRRETFELLLSASGRQLRCRAPSEASWRSSTVGTKFALPMLRDNAPCPDR